MNIPFPAYDGGDPYIFISYSHKDSEAVYPELKRLNQSGFKVWYDEGIAPGASWRDELAERLADCSVFVFFVTSSSVKSSNCAKEVNFALGKDRPILTIYLEQVSLPAGLEFSLSDVQAIVRHQLSDEDYHRKTDASLERLLPKSVSKIDDLRITGLIHHSKTYTQFAAIEELLDREVEVTSALHNVIT